MRRQILALVMGLVVALSPGESPAQHHGESPGRTGAPLDLGEVVVTANRIREYIENHPQQVETMKRDRIRQSGFTDLNQVLNAFSGVDVKKNGNGPGSRISVRGSGGSGKILFLINGRPATAGQYGAVDLDSLPLDMVSQVMVFKPPVPVWLGSGGTAGAINVVLANPLPEAAEEKKTTRIGLTGGSFGKAGMDVSHSTAAKKHRLRLSASAAHGDGRRTNSDSRWGRMGVQWDLPLETVTKYDVNGRFFQSEHGSPGPGYNLTPEARQFYQKGALDLRAQGPCSATGTHETKTYLDITRLEDRSQAGLVSTLDAVTYGVKEKCTWQKEDNAQALRLTGSLNQHRVDHSLSGAHHREQASVGLQADRRFDPFSATLGFRGDYASDFGFQPGAQGGISTPLWDAGLARINGGYGVNIPSFGQLYQPSHGAIDQVRGNASLGKELVWTVSTAISHVFSKGRTMALTLFREETDDKIVYQEGQDRIKRPVNIAGAYRQGIEAAVDWEINTGTRIDLSYLWQQSRNKENNKALTYAPGHKFKLRLNCILPTATAAEMTMNWVSRQFSDLENTPAKAVEGYTAFDLKLIQRTDWLKYPAEFFIYFENLFDEAYERHYGYPDDGFRITAGLNVDL